MLRLVLRRAWVQRRLLTAVVLLVAVATGLMGFYALLLDVTAPRAFSEQVQRANPADLDVTAYVVGVPGAQVAAAQHEAQRVLQQVLVPLHPSLVTTTTSQMREIGESGRLAYLASDDALARHQGLTSGRWPRDTASGPVEAVAPYAAAHALRLHLGDRLRLGPGSGLGGSGQRATVLIVGTVRGLPRPAAESDPLTGAGFDQAFPVGGRKAPAYGPFLVSPRALLGTGLDVEGLRVDAHPDLRSADDTSLRAAATSLGTASALLSDRVGANAEITRVASALPDTLSRLDHQRAANRSAVLVALLLDTMLGLAALLLAGRLLADSRADERDLLVALGLSPRQQLVSALGEALLLATAAAVLAVPAAAVAHAVVTHLPGLAAARLASPPTVTPGLLLTVVLGAALLTLVLVTSPLVGAEARRLSGRRRAVVRSGVDVLLLVAVVAGWWQVRTAPTSATGGDTVQALAPVVCLAATTVLVVRTLPALFSLATAAGTRSRALLPVSLDPAVLRLNAGTALALLSLAAAAATFGVALRTTWQRSQLDQADLRVGTDLSLALDAPPTSADAAAIARSVAGDADSRVSPVTARPVALGHYFGPPGDTPTVVALDTRQAGALLRGRLPAGPTWSDIGRRLTPAAAARSLPLPAGGTGVTLLGQAPAGVNVSVTPSLVVQDAAGLRSTLDAAPLPVDGRSHPLQWSALPPAHQRIVAVHLVFHDAGGSPRKIHEAQVSVDLHVPAPTGHPTPTHGWHALRLGYPDVVLEQSVSVRREAAASIVTTEALLRVPYLLYEDGDVLDTAFAPPTAVPVAVSQALVDATGTKVGGTLSATLGDSLVLFRVAAIVPTVPSAPDRIAVLADSDALSRALMATGQLEPDVDAFWVSHPAPRTAAALSRLGLGQVTTRDAVAAELIRGPMQITLPVAYLTVAGSAVLLLLAGALLVVSADRRRRTAEVARLRALGLSRRGARWLVFAQHGVLLVALVVTGALVGGGAALALDRALVRSDQGTAPVPAATLAWPWIHELLLTVGLIVACLLVAAAAAVTQVRRSDPAQLRSGEWE